MLVDKVRRILVVPHARVAAIKAGPPARIPEMFISPSHTPRTGQLDWSCACPEKGDVVVVDSIGHPTRADAVAMEHLPAAGLGHITDSAFRVGKIRADRVAPAEPRQIKESTRRRCPAIFVVGVTGDFCVGPSVISAGHLVDGAAHADKTPILVETQ